MADFPLRHQQQTLQPQVCRFDCQRPMRLHCPVPAGCNEARVDSSRDHSFSGGGRRNVGNAFGVAREARPSPDCPVVTVTGRDSGQLLTLPMMLPYLVRWRIPVSVPQA